MLTRVLIARLPSIHLIRVFSSSQSPTIRSPELIQVYGRNVPVEVPRLKDAVQFPVPPLHRDYETAWRQLTAWSSDYLERQDDLIFMARWNPAYSMGWMFPHFDSNAFLATLKIFWSAIYNDWLYDTRWTKKHKVQGGQEFMARLLHKKYPKDAQFKQHIEMCIDAYRSLKPWLSGQQDDDFKKATYKFLMAELLQPNKVDHQTNIDDYIKHRTATYMSNIVLKFQESVSGFALPSELKQHQDVDKLLQTFARLMWLPNDLVSFPNEQARDDHWNNFITVYARQNSVSLQEGIGKLVEYIDSEIVEFQTAMWRIVNNSRLIVDYPDLNNFLEVGLANIAYGNLQAYEVTGKYDGQMVYVKDPKRNDRIESKGLYARIKI